MIGICPKCRSINVHDCSAPEEIPAHEFAGSKIPKRTAGHDCPVALRIDDPCVGHCDSCGYIWCLECGNKLSEDSPICGHWKICDSCRKAKPVKDYAGEIITGMTTCPYNNPEKMISRIGDCPRIKKEIKK